MEELGFCVCACGGGGGGRGGEIKCVEAEVVMGRAQNYANCS